MRRLHEVTGDLRDVSLHLTSLSTSLTGGHEHHLRIGPDIAPARALPGGPGRQR